MRNNNNPGRAINFANIKSGDIIIADTLNAEDAFFTDAAKTRYALYTVETCNKVNNAILSPLTSVYDRSILTQDGDTYTIKPFNGKYYTINTAKVWHYTYFEATAMQLHERAAAQESLRNFIHRACNNNFMPYQVEVEFEAIYARHTGEQRHDATSIINPNSRKVMSRIIEDGIKVIRQLLDEEHIIIDESIAEGLAAYAEITDIMDTYVAPLNPDSESITVTDTSTIFGRTHSESFTFTTGTAIITDNADYLITRLADDKAYVTVAGETNEAGYLAYSIANEVSLYLKDSEPIHFVSLEETCPASTVEDIKNYYLATKKVTEIFDSFEGNLSGLRGRELNYQVRHENPLTVVGMLDYGNKCPNEALMLTGKRIHQLKMGRAALTVQADNFISTINYYMNQAHSKF